MNSSGSVEGATVVIENTVVTTVVTDGITTSYIFEGAIVTTSDNIDGNTVINGRITYVYIEGSTVINGSASYFYHIVGATVVNMRLYFVSCCRHHRH